MKSIRSLKKPAQQRDADPDTHGKQERSSGGRFSER